VLDHVSPPLAFLAGLVSFLSPCVLPLVPAYVAYLGGRAGDADTPSRSRLLLSGGAFVVGLTVVFVLLFYAFNAVLTPLVPVLAPIAGVLVILLALQLVQPYQASLGTHPVRSTRLAAAIRVLERRETAGASIEDGELRVRFAPKPEQVEKGKARR